MSQHPYPTEQNKKQKWIHISGDPFGMLDMVIRANIYVKFPLLVVFSGA